MAAPIKQMCLTTVREERLRRASFFYFYFISLVLEYIFIKKLIKLMVLITIF